MQFVYQDSLLELYSFVDKFTSTFVSICITNSIYTCGIGVHCLIDVHMKTVLDQNSLAKAFGWRTAVGGLFRALPGFLIGKFLWDRTFFCLIREKLPYHIDAFSYR